MGGGTLGCNWQPASSRFVWGVEAEAGVMRLSATVNNPYNLAFGFTDTIDSTTVGNWYGALRAGSATRSPTCCSISRAASASPMWRGVDRYLRAPPARTAAARRCSRAAAQTRPSW